MENKGQLTQAIQVLEREIQAETQELGIKEKKFKEAELNKDLYKKTINDTQRKIMENDREYAKLKGEIDNLKRELQKKQQEMKRITDSFNSRMQESGIKLKH